MDAKTVTPILNVSDIVEGFAGFEKLGWKKGFDWGDPPTFGSVCSGECEIFLCQGGQGGRNEKHPPDFTQDLVGNGTIEEGHDPRSA